jgi:nucleotide-binding universal stress UspA family protein
VVRSEKNATAMAETLTKLCAQMRVSLDIRRSLATLYASPGLLVDLARLHDLTILPVPETDTFGRSYVEAAIFDTGRPTLLLPSGERIKPLQRLDTIVVAWDYSREAARALADALPILTRANRVHILSVYGEKGIRTTCAPGDVEKYLTAHQVKYEVDQMTIKDDVIGECVTAYALEVDADMLVMGAYGHSRFREFILGGATREVLSNPHLPVLLSH